MCVGPTWASSMAEILGAECQDIVWSMLDIILPAVREFCKVFMTKLSTCVDSAAKNSFKKSDEVRIGSSTLSLLT